MLKVDYPAFCKNLNGCCKKVADECETVIVTLKGNKNVVLLSLTEYNSLIKTAKNSAYLNMIDRSMEQLSKGQGSVHDLIGAKNGYGDYSRERRELIDNISEKDFLDFIS